MAGYKLTRAAADDLDRLFEYGSHSIYFRIDADEIVIVRILGREDLGALTGTQ